MWIVHSHIEIIHSVRDCPGGIVWTPEGGHLPPSPVCESCVMLPKLRADREGHRPVYEPKFSADIRQGAVGGTGQ